MKKFIRPIITTAVILTIGIVPSLLAQSDKGNVTGHVTDTSGAILQGAQVEMQPGGNGMATNAQGAFYINGLTTGTYTITVTYVGFALFTKVVTISPGQTTSVDVQMAVASQSNQILVTAQSVSGEAEAINRERSADNILQVLTNEVFMSLPNVNVADAAGRLPGVSLERDEGEGKYIQVRSLEPRLTNATIDGVNVPSPEPGVREIKFDTMPADLLESVEVNKTLQANMDGDGIGGSVNLVTKTASERPTLALAAGGGSSAIMGGRTLTQTTGTIGQRFGTQKKFGLLGGGSYDWNGRGINDVEPVPDQATFANGTTGQFFDSQDMREYRYKRSRWGVSGTADYTLGEGSNIYIKGIYSNFHDYGDKWVYTLTDNTPLYNPGQYPNGIQLLNSNGCSVGSNNVETCGAGVPVFSVSNRVPVFTIGSVVLGGKHVFSTTWFTWDASISRSQELKSGGNEGADFATNSFYNQLYPNGSSCQFSPMLTTNKLIPQWTQNCYLEAYAPANYNLTDITTSYGKSPQLNLQFTGAWGKRYHLGSHLSTIEIGGKFRNAHKFDDSYTPVYDPNGAVGLTPFLSSFTDPGYYKHQYPPFGPTTDWQKIINYLNANQSQFTLQPGTTGPNAGNFDLVEQVSAGYVMDTLDLTSKIRIVAGLRIEGTSLFTSQPSFDANGNFLGNASQNGSYVNFLPSASVRYAFNSDTNLRVVYSRALSRPDPQDIAQAISVTIDQNPYLASLGNPNLKAETANNYDVLVEHYLQPFGMISGGFFYKQLYNPIVTTTQTFENYSPVPSDPANYPVGEWKITQPINAGSGWITGLEFAYLQHFTSLPGFFSGFGLSANYCYTDSRAFGLPDRTDNPRLLRQTPNIFNISPSYDHGPLSIRLGLTYNGASIATYQYTTGTAGGLYGPNGDNYFYPHFQVDLQGSLQMKYGFTLIAYGLNLNNEVFGFYNGQEQYLTQREFYGPTFALGIRWSPIREK